MTPDEALTAETRAWLDKSREDLQSARALIGAGLPASALLHCQQAAEKSFKAFLTWRRVAFRKTHDLEEVGAACVAVDPTLTSLVRTAEPLSAYSWEHRSWGIIRSRGRGSGFGVDDGRNCLCRSCGAPAGGIRRLTSWQSPMANARRIS